jgi:hypothetical protein
MTLHEPYDDRLMADLAAAADGALPPARQAELEAMAARDERLGAALDEQRRSMTLIRAAAAEVEAPLALRERLETGRTRLARPRARRRWLSVALPGAALAAVLALVLAGSGGPSIQDAAAFAGEPPAAGAPPSAGKVLRIDQDGVAFPDWAAKFGWRATGTRKGTVGGRPVTTVYYAKGGRTIAYAIVGGGSLGEPGHYVEVGSEGTPVQVFKTAGGKPAAAWERRGHTCVLTGTGVPGSKLAELAGWKGKGDVRF